MIRRVTHHVICGVTEIGAVLPPPIPIATNFGCPAIETQNGMARKEKSQSRTRGTRMTDLIDANDRVALAAVEDLPVLNVADLDADPHGMFRRYRAAYPLVGHETGAYLVL